MWLTFDEVDIGILAKIILNIIFPWKLELMICIAIY